MVQPLVGYVYNVLMIISFVAITMCIVTAKLHIIVSTFLCIYRFLCLQILKQVESISGRVQKELLLLHRSGVAHPTGTVKWLNKIGWLSSHFHASSVVCCGNPIISLAHLSRRDLRCLDIWNILANTNFVMKLVKMSWHLSGHFYKYWYLSVMSTIMFLYLQISSFRSIVQIISFMWSYHQGYVR